MIDAVAATAPGALRQWGGQPGEPDYSLRVSVAMWEKDLEAAWDYANRGACHTRLLLALASELETSHLDDALALYRRVVPGILEQTTNEAYADAIKVVQRMAAALGAHQRHRTWPLTLNICGSNSSASAISLNCSTNPGWVPPSGLQHLSARRQSFVRRTNIRAILRSVVEFR